MRQKVLIVEDEFLIARDIKGILEEEGFQCYSNAIRYADIINLIDKEDFAIVLLDINLNQEKDGVAIGQYLLNKQTIPYIYITSYSDKWTMERVKETRPHGFIVKPYKAADIIATVNIVLNNYQYKLVDDPDEIGVSVETSYRIKQVINYINQNIEEKIEIADLVALTKWKVDHFTRTFSKHLNVTPYQYILQRKIDRAKVLLSMTDIAITDVSYQLGFGSHANFYKAFKKYVGKSPDEYKRNKYRGK